MHLVVAKFFSSNSPSNGTDIEVDGIISAKSKKNTVSDSKMEMERRG